MLFRPLLRRCSTHLHRFVCSLRPVSGSRNARLATDFLDFIGGNTHESVQQATAVAWLPDTTQPRIIAVGQASGAGSILPPAHPRSRTSSVSEASLRAAPLVRANVKITVKNTVCEESSVSAYGVLTGNLGLARTSGAALTRAQSHTYILECRLIWSTVMLHETTSWE